MDHLLKAATLVLALAKTSRNVRNWRTYEGGDPSRGKLKPSTIDRRMDRYGRSLGLDVGHYPDDEGEVAPVPHKNRIETDSIDEGLLTSEHEFAHAMMTPPGRRMRPYFKWLNAQNEVERTTRHFFERNHGTARQRQEAEERIAPGSRHEKIAQAISPKIQRRAGVEPGVQNEFFPHKYYDQSEHQQKSKDTSIYYGDQARRYVRRWDEGMKFDSDGRVVVPSGPDAAINERARIAARGKNLVNSDQARDALRMRGQMSLERKS